MSIISLLVNGKKYQYWTNIRVNRSMDSPIHSFSFGTTSQARLEGFEIKAGDAAQVLINEDAIITGYIDSVNRMLDADNNTINIEGRSKIADMNDSIISKADTNLINDDIKQIYKIICKELAKPFGISVFDRVGANQPTLIALEQQSPLNELLKEAKNNNLILTCDGDGRLVIDNPSAKNLSVVLEEGKNIKSITHNSSVRGVYSKYKILSQITNDGLEYQEESTKENPKFKRYKPFGLVLVNNNSLDSCDARAEQECNRRNAELDSYQVEVQGWTYNKINHWFENVQIKLKAPSFGVDKVLLIIVVEFVFNEQGSTTVLTLKPREAYV